MCETCKTRNSWRKRHFLNNFADNSHYSTRDTDSRFMTITTHSFAKDKPGSNVTLPAKTQ